MEFWKSLIVVVMAILKLTEAASWTYTDGPYGPANWTKVSANCGGSLQSPIDYKTGDITYGQSLGAFVMKGYDTVKENSTVGIRNSGYSLVVDFDHPNAANISGAGLPPGEYTLLNIHFHWGNSDTEGSEYTVNGKAYPAEIHFVHYNTKYVGNLKGAFEAKDGLAVLGVFLKLDSSDNPAIKTILDYQTNVTAKGMNVTVPAFELKPLLPGNITEFYRNDGSLTTPNCQESVTWTVFNEVKTISQAQLTKLRSLKGEDGQPLLKTYRPVQPTNGRKILATFAKPSGSTASPKTTAGSGVEIPKAAILTSILCGLLSLILKY